jgi:L-ascorbate metabolism protein UlaG (beta-lactamase superfamily)
MKFTYFGHSCFLVEINGQKILFDPFITPNPLAKNIDINTIKCDFIAVSHGHADHIADTVAIAKSNNATVICAFEVYEWLAKQGLQNFRPMNTGGKWNAGGFTIKCVAAQHSGGLPDGTYGGNPMGFVVTSADKSFYYSGDTALTKDMELIPLWANLDFAVLPIGDNFTMDVADAVIAANFVKTSKVIGVHYNTFPYIVIDEAQAKQQFKDNGKELILINIGETINL